MIFGFLASKKCAPDALLLSASIRRFGGAYAADPILVMMPHGQEVISSSMREEFRKLDVRLEPYTIKREIFTFPFGAKVIAAAQAEQLARQENKNLVWMDSDSLLFQPPELMRLRPGKSLAYRPVDHTLVGSTFNKPLDDFWKQVYADCQVGEEKIFSMTASVDENRIRPYFNAGMLVVDPQKGLLQSWVENFSKFFQNEAYRPFYEKEYLYKIFVHQAILAGTVLAGLEQKELQELPYKVNYPLHMHKGYPAARKVRQMNELVSARHESFFSETDWAEACPAEEPLKSWLEEQLRLRVENMMEEAK